MFMYIGLRYQKRKCSIYICIILYLYRYNLCGDRCHMAMPHSIRTQPQGKSHYIKKFFIVPRKLLSLFEDTTTGWHCMTGSIAWWRHQMESFTGLLVLCEEKSPVAGGFCSLRSVTRSFGVFFDLPLNKWLSKHSKRRWFETPYIALYITSLYWHETL